MFLAVCAALTVLESFGDAGRALLRYERELIGAGEWWRLLSGHFVHLGWRHLALNVAGLALMWVLFFPDYSLGRWALIVACSLAAIDAGCFFLERSLRWYVGLSGVLHGVMAAGTLAQLKRREPGALLLLVLLAAKLAYEQFVGAIPYSVEAAGGAVVVDAHLYGAVGAAVAVIGLRLRRQSL